jgi:hypothetical protein
MASGSGDQSWRRKLLQLCSTFRGRLNEYPREDYREMLAQSFSLAATFPSLHWMSNSVT